MQATPRERLDYTPEEILASEEYAEPLIAGGVRCHGGFDASGAYQSPRTLYRTPAILAWQDQVVRGGGDLIVVDPALMPPQYPNVAQSKALLREGVREPIVRALTIISIVEGFGAIIRDVRVPDLDAAVVEPTAGTALAHLRRGLFEAHARDEAGYRDQGGHKQMWEAARDLALEKPKVPSDVLMRIMGRRGGGGRRERALPELGEDMERMLSTMVGVLLIEIFAAETFEWGKALLGDPEVSAEPERASAMVAHIQSDEKPHVEYLRTALSELRARTLRTTDGREVAGRSVVDGLLHGALRQMTQERPQQQRDDVRKGLAEAVKEARSPAALAEEFESLATQWNPPPKTGFEPGDAAGERAPS